MISREEVLKIVYDMDERLDLSTKEFNLVRNAIIDTHIEIAKSVGTCKECIFLDAKNYCGMYDLYKLGYDYCSDFERG